MNEREPNEDDTEICNLLDVTGFSPRVVTFVQNYFNELGNVASNILQEKHPEVGPECCCVGSIAEGLMYLPQMISTCDVDMMFTFQNVCLFERHTISPQNVKQDVYQMVFGFTYPGYAMLRRISGYENQTPFHNLHDNDQYADFLSANVFHGIYADNFEFILLIKRMMSSSGQMYAFDHGPANSISIAANIFTDSFFNINGIDYVFALACEEWPSVADEWIERDRKFDWPSNEMICHIVGMGCHVVPVGIPGSPTLQHEWRVSFAPAEKYLIHSMNSIQLKIYVILKLQMKQKILGELASEMITSYVIKTALFWVLEESDTLEMQPKNVLKYVRLCYVRILQWIEADHWPNYFMRECNLIQSKFTTHKKRLLKNKIDEYLRSANVRQQTYDMQPFKGLLSMFSLGFVQYFHSNIDIFLNVLDRFTSRILDEGISVVLQWALKTSYELDITNAVREVYQHLRKLKNRTSSITLSRQSVSETLIRLLSCSQIRLLTVACHINRDQISKDYSFHIISKIINDAKLQTATLCISEIVQIAHVYFCHGFYENTLTILTPVLQQFESKKYIRMINMKSFVDIVSVFAIYDQGNDTSFTSPRRPINNIVFYDLEQPILTKHLQLEKAVLNFQKGMSVFKVYLDENLPHFDLVVDPMVYACYMQYKCLREMGINIGACNALKDLQKYTFCDIPQHSTALNLLGCCLVETGYHREAAKCFATSYDEDKDRLSTLYQMAILIRKCTSP